MTENIVEPIDRSLPKRTPYIPPKPIASAPVSNRFATKTNAERLRPEHRHIEGQTQDLIADLEDAIKLAIQSWERDNASKIAQYSQMGVESLACAALYGQLSYFGRKAGRE